MLTSIIRAVIRFRAAVLLAVAALVLVSLYSLSTAPLDAIPDIADPQVVVYVKWARSAELLETEVTAPLVAALRSIPDVAAVRATSHLGFSFIYVVLREARRRDAVRELVRDRINELGANLPADATITLGPNAGSMGWIYEYALVDREGTRDLRELRQLNDARVKPALESVAGVAEAAAVGGLERQVELKIFPPLLAATGLTLRDLVTALGGVEQVGGRTIELTGRDYQLRGGGQAPDLDELERLVVGRAIDGQPVELREIGYLQVSYDVRRGIADLDGTGEVVGGIVIMAQGQNVLAVAAALDARLEEVKAALPDGIEIVTTYDRSTLIWATLENFFTALAYELAVVMLVIVWALRNARAAVAPVAVLLLGCLLTVLPLAAFGQTINLLSLAGLAIAIGEMADATIVIVENCTTELARRGNVSYAERIETIVKATARMTRPLLFSLLIILASFLPIFFLGEREGRLFDPLAYSKTSAMAFSTLLTLGLLPIIIVWAFKTKAPAPRGEREGAFVRGYRAALRAAIRLRYAVVAASVGLLVFAVVMLAGFRKDYMPEMEEGSILYMPTTLPGLPTREAGWILQQMDRKLKEFPEVERVFGKLGRADTATDPAPMTMIETTILLKPESEWRPGLTKQALVAEMDAALAIVGFVNAWTQPIAARVSMQDTGIQTPVGIKVKGPDLRVIEETALRIETLLRTFPGTASVIAERIAQGYYVDVEHDFGRLADHGVTIDEALLTIRYAIGGENVVNLRQPDDTVVPLSMQYSPEYIDTLEKVRKAPVITAGGATLPLDAIAAVEVQKLPEMIRNDDGELAGYVLIDLADVTGTDYVAAARAYLAEQLELPAGYSLEWTGTHRYNEEAKARLVWIVPLTLLITLGLLLAAFKSWPQSLLILLAAPFALVGGVLLQWLQGYALTTAVIIGYVAVLAIAVQTGIIMVEFIRDALARRTDEQPYVDAVIEGSVARLRPKLMTVATTVLGLVPIMLASGSGFDITQPIAAPSVGGMLTSTIYVLFLIPCLFAIAHDFRSRSTKFAPGRRRGPSRTRRPVVNTLLMADRITHRSTDSPERQAAPPPGEQPVSGSIASLDATLTPTATERALETEGTSVYVLSKDSELVAALTVAGSGRVRVHVIWSFRELRRHVERGECKIILLDADFFEGSPRSWIEELCALEPTLVVLVAAPRETEQNIAELVAERLVHRVMVKPVTVNMTRPVLEAAVDRYIQLSDEIAAASDKVEAARGNVAPAVSEIPVPRNELLAMRQAAARNVPIRAERRKPVARAKTYWPAWFLPIGLVVAIVVALSVGDFPSLELRGSSEDNASAPSEPSFAEPVDAEAPPEDQVVGRTEDAFLPGEPAAEAPTEAEAPPADSQPEPAATVVPDAALASEIPAADAESASVEPAPEPTAALPALVGPPAEGPQEPRPAVTGSPSPATAAVAPPSPAPAVVPAPTTPTELESLVATAWSRVRANRLLDPPGDSARDYVTRATELDPGHPDVIAIRSLLAEAVAESARTALESGDLAAAETLTAEALRLGASDETLAVLDLDLAAAREVAARRSNSDLLELGVARIREDRLIAPPNDNALDYLRRLRAENPDYPGLDSAWQSLGEALTGKIEASVAAEDWQEAEAWLEPLALVASPATIERFRAEVEVRQRQAEYLATPAAQGELKLLTAVDPVYPEEAQRREIAGWVDVEFIVGTDGIPREARVVGADPPVTFDQAALAAVSLYRYEPFERDGHAYERLGRLRLRFDLR